MTVFVMGCFSVSAATKTGFVTQKGKTYYINKDGSKQKGWLELKGKKYYFDKKTGVQVKGWVKDSSGQAIRYFRDAPHQELPESFQLFPGISGKDRIYH